MNDPSKRSRWLQGGLTLLLLLVAATPAAAFKFTLGEVQGSLDSTLSYGMNYRVADRDRDIIGIANGGTAYSVNGDDGNLNYDDDEFFSKVLKLTSDLELKYENYGLFLRGTAFYDFVNAGGDGGERTEITDKDALDQVGKDLELLDAYVWWDFDLGGMPGTLRVGDQVLSWGESTFIQNSINAINPVDVNKLRVPGSELKEALTPVGMISAALAANEHVSIEGFYQYKWEETKVDPVGSYWSTSDGVGDGGHKFMFGFGSYPDSVEPGTPGLLWAGIGAAVPRGATVEADDDGQYGLALHLLAPELNDTEFGFYFINYHSRLPIISAKTGTALGFAQFDYAKTAQYFTEYPEDIKLYGLSFNTQVDALGVALQGEYSFRQDVPVQIDEIELLLAALSPLDPILSNVRAPLGPEIFSKNQLGSQPFSSVIHGYKEMDVSQVQMTATKAFGPMFGADQFVLLGEVGMTYVHSMPSKDQLRFESPGTYTSGNVIPVDVTVPYEVDPGPPPVTVPLTIPGGGPPLGPGVAHPGKPAEPADAFADATSWGYRAVAKLDFNNAIGAVSLSPRIAWAHDVDGNSPNPGGNFLEHRKAVTVGLEANYQNAWSADLSYIDFFGAGRYNLINDRDFVSFNVKYSF